MRVSQAKMLFHSLVQEYFAGATVNYAYQSRAAKSDLPLINLTPGNVSRHRDPVMQMIDGELVNSFHSCLSVQIDLYTKGAKVIDLKTGRTIAYENTAVDDMLSFADFLNSQYVIHWCHTHDTAIAIEGDIIDLTGVVNDNNYEFRSRMSVLFYFTQNAVGYTGTLSEDSIRWQDGKKPDETESTTGIFGHEKDFWDGATIQPEFKPTSTGGGSEELASKDTGYFTEAEIKEESTNE